MNKCYKSTFQSYQYWYAEYPSLSSIGLKLDPRPAPLFSIVASRGSEETRLALRLSPYYVGN